MAHHPTHALVIARKVSVWIVLCVGVVVLLATSRPAEEAGGWSVSGDTTMTFKEGVSTQRVVIQADRDAVEAATDTTLVVALLRDVYAADAEVEGWTLALDDQNPREVSWSIKNAGAVGLLTWETSLSCEEQDTCTRTLVVSRVDDTTDVTVQVDVLYDGERPAGAPDDAELTLTIEP